MSFSKSIGGRAVLAGALPLLFSALVAGILLWKAPPVDPDEARLAGIERTMQQKALGRGNLDTARKAARRVSESLDKLGADLKVLSDSPDLVGKSIDPRNQQKQLQDFAASHPTMKWLVVVSDTGAIIASAPADSKEARPGSKFQAGSDLQTLEKAGGSLTRGEILPSNDGAEQNLLLGVEREGRRATVVARISYAALLKDALDVLAGSQAFLVDTQPGKKVPYLAHSDPSRMGKRFNPQGDPQLVYAENDMVEGLSGYADSYIEGKDRTVSYAPVPGWTLALGVVVEHQPASLGGEKPLLPGPQDLLDLLRQPLVAVPLLLILAVVLASPWVGGPATAPLKDLESRLKTAQEGDEDALLGSPYADAKGILDKMREVLNKTREDFAQKLHEKETEAEELAKRLEEGGGAASLPASEEGASGLSEEQAGELQALKVVVQTLRDENDKLTKLAEEAAEIAAQPAAPPPSPAPPPPSADEAGNLAVLAVSDLANQARDLVDQVTGFAELAARDPESLPQAQRQSFMDTIRGSEAGLRQFGTDIGVYLRSRGGAPALESLPFNKLFAECLAQVEGGANLQAHVSDQEVRVQGPKESLRNALTNILLQASRDAAKGADVGLSLEVEDGGITLTVADTGLILSERQASDLLEGYVGTEDIPPGVALSGLGLHLAKVAAQTAGGALVLAPRGPGGTDLVLRLPGEVAGWAQAPAEESSAADEVIAVEDETILASEEAAPAVSVMEAALAAAGAEPPVSPSELTGDFEPQAPSNEPPPPQLEEDLPADPASPSVSTGGFAGQEEDVKDPEWEQVEADPSLPPEAPAPVVEEDIVEVVDLNPESSAAPAPPSVSAGGLAGQSPAVADVGDLDLGGIPEFNPSAFEEPGAAPAAVAASAPAGGQEFDPSAFEEPSATPAPEGPPAEVVAAQEMAGTPPPAGELDFSAFDEEDKLPNPPPAPLSDDNWPAPPGQGPLRSAFDTPAGLGQPLPPPPPPSGGAPSFDPKLWEN